MRCIAPGGKYAKKQDGSHEPECIHVLGLRVKTSAIGKRTFFFHASCAHIVSAKAPDQQFTKRQLTHKDTHGKHRLKTVHISPVTSLQCGVESVECGVWSGECRVWSVECKVRSVECKVGSVECVKCRVWSVECKV